MPTRAPAKITQAPIIKGATWEGNTVRVCTNEDATSFVPFTLPLLPAGEKYKWVKIEGSVVEVRTWHQGL